MDHAADGRDQQSLVDPLIAVTAAFECEEIAVARDLARTFLTGLQAVHGIAVSGQVVATVQLVVSELVTNAGKYAPGPCMLTSEATDSAVDVTVWDSAPTMPIPCTADPGRVGQHGLVTPWEILRPPAVTGHTAPHRTPARDALRLPKAGQDIGSRHVDVLEPGSVRVSTGSTCLGLEGHAAPPQFPRLNRDDGPPARAVPNASAYLRQPPGAKARFPEPVHQ